MRDGLYNRGAYGLPKGAADTFTGRQFLDYAKHAKDAIKDELTREGLPGQIDIEAGDVVEVLVLNNDVIKAVIRWPFDDVQDLCLVIEPARSPAARGCVFVRTVWFNAVSDTHAPLNKTVFSHP
jgi:hypothetical protein